MKKNYYAASKYWQCSECGKWRYVGKEAQPTWDPETWTCEDNPYKPQSSCEERDAFEDIGIKVYLTTKHGEKVEGSLVKLNVPKEEASEGKYPFLAITCSCQRCTTKFAALPDNMWQGMRWYQDHCSKDKAQRWTILVQYKRFDGDFGPIAEWLKFNADKWGMTHNSKCVMPVGSITTVLPQMQPSNDKESTPPKPRGLLPAGVRIASINDPSFSTQGMKTVQSCGSHDNSDTSREKKEDSQNMRQGSGGFLPQKQAGDELCNGRPSKFHKPQSVADLEKSVATYKSQGGGSQSILNAGDPKSQIEVIQAQQDILNNTTQLQQEAISRVESQLKQIDASMHQNEQFISQLQQNQLNLSALRRNISSDLKHLVQQKQILEDTIEVMQTQLSNLQEELNPENTETNSLQTGIQINVLDINLQQQQQQQQKQLQQPSQQIEQQQVMHQQIQQQQQQQLQKINQQSDMEVDVDSNGNLHSFVDSNNININSCLTSKENGEKLQHDQNQLQNNLNLNLDQDQIQNLAQINQENDEVLQNGEKNQWENSAQGIGSALLVTMLMDAAREVDFKDQNSCCRTILYPLIFNELIQ